MTDGNTEQMEFRKDDTRPNTYVIDGVRFSGELLRAMTQPDPKRLHAFRREGNQVHVSTTNTVNINEQVELLKQELETTKVVKQRMADSLINAENALIDL